MSDAASFLRAHTHVTTAPLVPEIRLHLASELTPIWQATEAWLREQNIEPPFWAFAWPGSQALARWVLDTPASVAGLRVLDFAAGGGLAAIACVRAGAAHVTAAEIDKLAHETIAANAALNGTALDIPTQDLVGAEGPWDIILAGDVCYEAPMTRHILPWLRARAAAGTRVILADPGRAYLPREGLTALARYTVPTTRELEDTESRMVTLWQVSPSSAG